MTQAPPDYLTLIQREIPRERALLAVRVGSLRMQRDWNWYELGRHAGLKDVQIQEIEEGRRDPEFTTLVRLAKALELSSLDQLLRAAPLEI